jgi:hypothetical protein
MSHKLKLVIALMLSLTGTARAQDDAGANRCFFAAKTNVALLGAAAIANAEAELFLPVMHKLLFSINVPVVYSPYTVSGNWKYRLFVLQPEFRWWLSDGERWWLRKEHPTNGHFVGLHTHLAWFNVAVNSQSRFQGQRGVALPLWGMGASYGYAFALPWWKGCGIELTLGLGYARITYDEFNNEPNGARYAAGVEHYWGITRLGVTLIHHFN